MANFFSRLFSSEPSQSVLGVDIGSSAIKVVQLRRKSGKAVLETYGAIALGPYGQKEVGQPVMLPEGKIVEALSDVIIESKVNTKYAGIAIPFRSSLMAVMEMPDLEEKKLEKMIPMEARKYIPVPISEVMLDWSIVPRTEEERKQDEQNEKMGKRAVPKIDVLAVAVHNDALSRLQSISKKAELQTSFFEIEVFSAMRSVIEDTTSPVMIFDMGATTTKLYIVERGLVRSSHIINRGSQDITMALSKSLSMSIEQAEILKRKQGFQGDEDTKNAMLLTLDYVFNETSRVILNFHKKYNKNITKIVLTGGGSALKGLINIASERLESEVVLGNPFGNTETPAFLENILKNTGPEFAVSVGLALRLLQESE